MQSASSPVLPSMTLSHEERSSFGGGRLLLQEFCSAQEVVAVYWWRPARPEDRRWGLLGVCLPREASIWRSPAGRPRRGLTTNLALTNGLQRPPEGRLA